MELSYVIVIGAGINGVSTAFHLAHAAGEIDSTIVRPGDVYGPGSRPWTTRPVKLVNENSLHWSFNKFLE